MFCNWRLYFYLFYFYFIYKINIHTYIYIYTYTYVKKAHDVTVMNPKLDTYFLHSLQGQLFYFHSLKPFLKAATLVNSFNSKGTISQTLGPKYEIL